MLIPVSIAILFIVLATVYIIVSPTEIALSDAEIPTISLGVTVSPVLTSPCSRLPVGGVGVLAAVGDASNGFRSGINPP